MTRSSALTSDDAAGAWSARLSSPAPAQADEVWLEIVVQGSGDAGRQACEALVLREQRESGEAWVVVRACSALPLSPLAGARQERTVEQRLLSPAQVALALMTARASNRRLEPAQAVAAPSQLMAASVTRYVRADPH